MTEITYRIAAEDVASKTVEVTVPVERLADAERRAVREYARQIRLPGFRKGHAPEAVVRKKFDQEIKRWILEDSLRQGWELVLKEAQLKPTADPHIRKVTFEPEQPLTFEILVEIRPELALATVGGFAISRPAVAVTEEMVEEQLDRLREQKATWTPLEGVQPAPGHLVSVSVTTIEAGKEPVDGAPYSLVIGQGQAIPELEEMVLTLKPGETTEGDVRFPEDHPDATRRGQSRRIRVTLHEVKSQLLPPLDDAFAREVGEFESAAALTAQVREDVAAEATRNAEQAVREQLVQKIVEANNVPAPENLVHRLLHAYAEGYQIPKEQFETFAQSFHPIAESQVRRELVLDAIATAQNLHATEQDLDARVAELAGARGVEPGKLYASLQQANRLGELERSLTEEKTFSWLLSQSTVTESAA